MSISFYLPLWPFAVYALVGLALYVPFVYWANSFISGNRGAFSGARPLPVIRDILVSVVAWPLALGYFIREEWKRRWKGIGA
jgi:hypothetical protein